MAVSGLGKVEEGEGQAYGRAVEGHAAVPEAQGLHGIAQVDGQVVEEHVAYAAAEYASEHADDDEVVDVAILPAVLDGPAPAKPPADEKAHDVHEAVPADFEAADGKGNGVDVEVHVGVLARLGSASRVSSAVQCVRLPPCRAFPAPFQQARQHRPCRGSGLPYGPDRRCPCHRSSRLHRQT